MVRPTADGRANGSAGEPRWLRPPAAVEPADGTDGPADHGSPADPLGAPARSVVLDLVAESHCNAAKKAERSRVEVDLDGRRIH